MPDAARPQVFLLGAGQSDPQGMTPDNVGAKAFNLMRVDRSGLTIPPAFVLSAGFCRDYLERGGKLPDNFAHLLMAHVRWLENVTGRSFGGTRRPLLVSVRSAPPVSMPGMLATILNVGLNNRTVRGLLRFTGDPHLAWDLYRRLIESFAETVHGADREAFEAALRAKLADEEVQTVQELDAESLRDLAREQLDLLLETSGESLPQDPTEQLTAAVEAVFRSWECPRAVEYRRLTGTGDGLGTAVLVQAMVFGNTGGASGTGVGFTRNPDTGVNDLYLDFLFNAQGEDIVSGRASVGDTARLRAVLPAVDAELARIKLVLESEFRDVQDFEFTVEEGRLYVLQTRTAKRTPWAALHVAVDMVREGLVDPATALERLARYDLDGLERVRLADAAAGDVLATAVPAGMGVAVGAIALDTEHARRAAEVGRPVILVRPATSTEDIAGFALADGLLTAVGGRTSHAAVVARHLGKTCLVGCAGLEVDLHARRVRFGTRELAEGDWLSLDGESGRVYAGRLPVIRERPVDALAEIARWRTAAAAPAAVGGTG